MPRAKKSAGTNPRGTLAIARSAAAKVLKKPEEDWRVVLDYEQLKKPMPHIPTGSLVTDYLIGGEPNQFGVRPCPGLPRSRVSQVWGHESSGKTTLALTATATTCAAGGTVLYIDWENDIVPDYAAAIGVPITDPDLFELAQPETLEDGIKLAMVYATAGVDLIVFDSVGSAMPKRIADRPPEEIAEQARVGELQSIWSQELPNIKKVINKSGTAVLGISQIRAKINAGGGGYGGPTTQPQGGNAWKFYSSVRLELRRIKQEKTRLHNVLTHKQDERVVGGVIQTTVIKCKLSKSQGRKEVFYIRWGEGIDDLRSVLEIGIAHGVIKRGGSWLTWTKPDGTPVKVQGVNPFRDHLKKNPEDVQILYNAVIPFLGDAQVAEEDMEDLGDIEEMLAAEADEMKEGPDMSEPEQASESEE
jgi:recombination protein RecA